MPATVGELNLSPSQFAAIATIARERWGLHFTGEKVGTVGSRVATHVRRLGLSSIEEYLERLRRADDAGNEEEMLAFFDLLSTNVTSFFRDPEQFAYLEREFYTGLKRGTTTTPGKRIRLWSAASSTGAEAYSLAIQAHELLGGPRGLTGWDLEILGTDLSNSVLAAARRGVYAASMIEGMDRDLVKRHFLRGVGKCAGYVKVRNHLSERVTFRRMNLVDAWGGGNEFVGKFQVILCKNVMIYFDQETKMRLMKRFHEALTPGGILVLGSAETMAGKEMPFRSAAPSIYVK